MRGVVYIDILFFVNAVIGYFLLRSTARLAGKLAVSWRILVGSLAAGLSSFLLLLPPLPAPLAWGAKIGSAVLIVFIAFPVHSPRGFLKGCFWYAFLNVALSGLVLAVLWYSSADGMMMNNLSVYFNVSPLLLIGSILVMYLLLTVSSALFGRPHGVRTVPFRAVFEEGAAVSGLALLDTGFAVRDPITGAQAFLLSFPAVCAALPPALHDTLATYFDLGAMETGGAPMRLVPTRTAAGVRALPAVRARELVLQAGNKKSRLTDVCAVFTREPLGDGSFCAIVSADSAPEE